MRRRRLKCSCENCLTGTFRVCTRRKALLYTATSSGHTPGELLIPGSSAVEQATVNRLAGGSNPSRGANNKNGRNFGFGRFLFLGARLPGIAAGFHSSDHAIPCLNSWIQLMLSDVRIIEIEALGPAPFASMLLADLGADVITVHRKTASDVPGKGDNNLLDRGKRSIALDLKAPEDVAVLKALLRGADGLIEGFRPGVMERLGLGPDECLAVQPRLVYGRMTGWGQDGLKAREAGHDLNYIGISGALWYASPEGTAPFPPPTLVGDIGGGALYLVIGMLSALLKARATGQGTIVDAAIVDGSAHMMNLLMSLRAAGSFQTERGHSLLDGPHWSRAYRCSDGSEERRVGREGGARGAAGA